MKSTAAVSVRPFLWVLSSLLFFFMPNQAQAQVAHVQFIHNAPEVSIDKLRLFVGDSLYVADFWFRSATPYLDVPAGIPIVLGLTESDTNLRAGDAFYTQQATFTAGQTYVVVAQGLRNPDLHQSNPDDLSTGIEFVVQQTRLQPANAATAEFLFIHGMPDAPRLDIGTFSGGSTDRQALFGGIAYGASGGYQSVADTFFSAVVTPSTTELRYLGLFPFLERTFLGRSLVMLTSGFVNKFGNRTGQVGPEIRLLMVEEDGTVIADPPAGLGVGTTGLQIINNSPDVVAGEKFDILFDGGLAFDDMAFRTATPFFLVPPRPIRIDVAHSETGEVFASGTANFQQLQDYVLVINGVVDTTLYAANPLGVSTELSFVLKENARRASTDSLGVAGDFIAVNGIPDAPLLDIAVTDMGVPVSLLPYNDVTGYMPWTSFFDVVMEGYPSGEAFPVLFRHALNMPFVSTRAFVLITSGFVNPASNQNGRPAKVFIVLPDGFVVDPNDFAIPGFETPRVQFVHAVADPLAETVDVYIENTLAFDDMSYRDATPFLDMPIREVNVSFAPANSQNVGNAILTLPVSFEPG